ncbi:solute carrier family 49 member 4 homolog isoform X2 [Bolinopsis microptera]|uniref:solute carrier family 49 member 4 homolog isoform X2 n=1 Tax=Bolinopsis microptera TaxID=2820187 RepID=UPI003079585A
MSDDERQRLINDNRKAADQQQTSQVISQEAFRATPARWYILFAFCYMGMVQGFVGNAWGPIASAMKQQYEWDDKRTSLLAMWMSAMFIPGAVLFPWIMAATSMRFVILANTTLMALAGVIKILSVTAIPYDYLVYSAHITQIINGFCGAVPFSGVMYVTVNWFPTKERIVATGVVMATLNTGIAIPFLLGPLLIPEPDVNSTLSVHTSSHIHGFITDDSDHDRHFYDQQLRWYLVIQGISMIFSLVFVAIYFPSRPQFAPTASAVAARLSITEGLSVLLRRGNFWLVAFAYALTSGTFNGYGLTFDVIMEKCKIDQKTAGLLGFVGLLASVPTNILIGSMAAFFSRWQKFMNVTILSAGTLAFFGFVAEIENWIPRNMAVVWILYVFGTMCITGVVPLLFDMSTESSHPVSEELSSTIMVLGNQMMCNVFTVILQIPNLITDEEKDRLNYVLLASYAIAILLSVLYRTTNVRLLIDAYSITIDQLDTRSIQQIRNAGVRM